MKPVLPLTDLKVKNLKPQNKRYKVSDGGGLYLEIYPTGGKSWRFQHFIDSKEKRSTLGQWPDVSLKEARDLAVNLKHRLKLGEPAKSYTFEALWNEWFEQFSPTILPKESKRRTYYMNKPA
jgi:hypothetical protein